MQMLAAFWIQVARRSHRCFANSSQLHDASKGAMALEHSNKNKHNPIQAYPNQRNEQTQTSVAKQFSMSHSRSLPSIT